MNRQIWLGDPTVPTVHDEIAQGLKDHPAKKGMSFNLLVTAVEIGGSIGLFHLATRLGASDVVGYLVGSIGPVVGGLATAAVRELCRRAAARHGLRTVRAATSLDNTASQKLLTKAGFVPVGPADPADIGGKQGTWYQRDLADSFVSGEQAC